MKRKCWTWRPQTWRPQDYGELAWVGILKVAISFPTKAMDHGWIRGSKHQIVNHQPGTLGSPLSVVPLKTSPQRLAPKSGESFTFRGFLEICVLSQVSLNFKEFVNKMLRCCWWFRNPANQLYMYKTLVTYGINYQPQLVRRISSIEYSPPTSQPPGWSHRWGLTIDPLQWGVCRMSWVFLNTWKKNTNLMETTENSCKPQFLVTMWFVFFWGNTLNSLLDWNCEILNSYVFVVKTGLLCMFEAFFKGLPLACGKLPSSAHGYVFLA